MDHPQPRRPRGAALPLALILLGVLTVIGVAAVSLSSLERRNAASYSRVDFVNECANAAQAKLWAEVAAAGPVYLGATTTVTSIQLPDGTKLTSPAHYDTPSTSLVKDVIVRVASSAGAGGDVNERDCTNNACGLNPLGSTSLVMARCTDAHGRELEIELGIRFAL